MLDGSSGEKKVIENQNTIKEWLVLIKDIQLVPDDNQEGRVGYIFGISLFKGEENRLGFTPDHINKIYYKSNPEFEEQIRKLFNEQFGREF
ncbi:hypothetical protein [Cohnella abietis]|uniref:Uncharacterized protein n=1 Tax=Cohnella abietis TaxID=2507935 RepID=A0A3T1D830_9BACL|nr:hypothetical protein [Cohnella abietis]BBI34228.1 hypothetical protein KCTCHS21_36270 [Cohnella abietis]